MSIEKKNEYAKVLLDAYNDNLINIFWYTSGFSIGVDPKREKFVPKLKEKEFVNYAFSIIKIVGDLAEGNDVSDIQKDDLETAKSIYNQEKDLKNHLYIKKNSRINCFKYIDSQIISYRNEENPKEIEVNSAIVKVAADNDNESSSYVFEISRRDLEDIIDNLMKLKEKMDSI